MKPKKFIKENCPLLINKPFKILIGYVNRIPIDISVIVYSGDVRYVFSNPEAPKGSDKWQLLFKESKELPKWLLK